MVYGMLCRCGDGVRYVLRRHRFLEPSSALGVCPFGTTAFIQKNIVRKWGVAFFFFECNFDGDFGRLPTFAPLRLPRFRGHLCLGGFVLV